jgi:hypothetical protein
MKSFKFFNKDIIGSFSEKKNEIISSKYKLFFPDNPEINKYLSISNIYNNNDNEKEIIFEYTDPNPNLLFNENLKNELLDNTNKINDLIKKINDLNKELNLLKEKINNNECQCQLKSNES